MTMLMLVVILKALAEIAGMALLAQGALFYLAGAARETNMFYRVLATITAPVRRVARPLTPGRPARERDVGIVAFCLVAGLWLALTIVKVQLVLHGGAVSSS